MEDNESLEMHWCMEVGKSILMVDPNVLHDVQACAEQRRPWGEESDRWPVTRLYRLHKMMTYKREWSRICSAAMG
jgi:hypothetical protein